MTWIRPTYNKKEWEWWEGRWSFFLHLPWRYSDLSRGGGGGGSRNTVRIEAKETIKEKCKHETDKRHRTLQLPVLNSPLHVPSADTSLESSDCTRLLSNRDPVKTVSETGREHTALFDNAGLANGYNQAGCLRRSDIMYHNMSSWLQDYFFTNTKEERLCLSSLFEFMNIDEVGLLCQGKAARKFLLSANIGGLRIYLAFL